TRSAVLPRNTTIEARTISLTSRSFCSSSSTANNSMRFCSNPRPESQNLRSEERIPPDGGSPSAILLAPGKHSDEQTQPERQSDGLIRVVANGSVGCLRAFDGFLLGALNHRFEFIENAISGKTLTFGHCSIFDSRLHKVPLCNQSSCYLWTAKSISPLVAS